VDRRPWKGKSIELVAGLGRRCGTPDPDRRPWKVKKVELVMRGIRGA